MQSSSALSAGVSLPAPVGSSSSLLSHYLFHAASAAQPAAVVSLGPASSLVCSTSSSSTGTPSSSPSVSSASSSIVSAVTTSSSSSSSAAASPVTGRSRSNSSTAPRRRLSSRYELCVHARLNCSCSCRSEVTKSHRWQHAYRARHTGCDCRWRELRESGRRKKRKHSRDGGEQAARGEDKPEGEEEGETAEGAAVGSPGKDGAPSQSDGDDGEDHIEEIAPFDERVRLFANAPRSPPAMSASYLAPTYAPLSLDTVQAHVLPAEAAPLHSLYPSLLQSTYSAPVVQQQQHHHHQPPSHSPQLLGGLPSGSNFATPASLALMLPPAAPTMPRSTSSPPNTANHGYMSQLHNNFPLSFTSSPSLQHMQQTVSMSASPPQYGSSSLGLGMQQSLNQSLTQSAGAVGGYPNGLQLSPMQLSTALNGLAMGGASNMTNMQLASLQAAMQQQQQQQQQQQLLPINAVVSQHALSHFLPQTISQHTTMQPAAFHTLSSAPNALSLQPSLSTQGSGAVVGQSPQAMQQSTPLFVSPAQSTASAQQQYTSALASQFVHANLSSPAQYLPYTTAGPSSSPLLSIPHAQTLAGLPGSPPRQPHM